MAINVCPVCGKEHKDFDNDIRFRCTYCNAEFPNWEDKLHRELEKAILYGLPNTHQDERKKGKNRMADREKVLKALTICSETGWCENNTDCPYFDPEKEMHFEDCKQMLKDALELLKEQEQALKREYMRGYDKAWYEIGRR